MILGKCLGRRGAREKWDDKLVWFRLRYLEASRPTRCLNMLSRSEACGRIALYYQPGDTVSELYLGIPQSQDRLLRQMAADFSLSLKPKSPEVSIPPARRLVSTTVLPWNQPFLAHISQEYLFVSLLAEGEKREGSYLPFRNTAKNGERPPDWQLPQPAPVGLTLQPPWDELSAEIPHWLRKTGSHRDWPLGRNKAGNLLQVPGCLNLYGRQDSVAAWLVNQVTYRVSVAPGNLVVIDGLGDLVPQLKRKAAVTQLFGKQLTYIDIDSISLTNGFNPLAAVPGETDKARLIRWQRWFEGMLVHPQGVRMLARARADGVEDILGLVKWLKREERLGQNTALSSLRMALDRLTANRALRERLEWPINPLETLPEGLLLFACKASDWARQQILRSVLLSVMQLQEVSLVIHGFNWDNLDEVGGLNPLKVVLSNGPVLAESTVILTESHSQGVTSLANRFFEGNKQWKENLELLNRNEALVISNGACTWTSWHEQ